MLALTYVLAPLLQVAALKKDATEILSLIRTVENSLAPINRIPPEVFSLIPEYWSHAEMDENLISLTHVCRGWREALISRPWLWARLDCTNIAKTHAFIQRAKGSPLEISLCSHLGTVYLQNVFSLVIPKIMRFTSISIVGSGDIVGFRDLFRNLPKRSAHLIPSLEELRIDLTCNPAPALDNVLHDVNLSLLRTLSLGGVITSLPWKNLQNLTAFDLRFAPNGIVTVTKLLDFFINAPHLNTTTLHSLPSSSDALHGRIVSLSNLREFTIIADPKHSILLNHLSIPAGVSLILKFRFADNKPQFCEYLPRNLGQLENIASITAVNIRFDGEEISLRLHGKCGELYMFCHRKDGSVVRDRGDPRCLVPFNLSETRTLTIMKHEIPTPTEPARSAPFKLLARTMSLRTITLTQCNNLPFILALDPGQNPSEQLLCPNLEKLVLYVGEQDCFNITELINMAKGRALKGARLRVMTIVSLGEFVPGKEAFKLRAYVAHVEYRFEEKPPKWDDISDR